MMFFKILSSLIILGLVVIEVSSRHRIVGGVDANINDYPYQIGLLYRNSQICGGAIISNRYVVTAGHCIYGKSTSLLSVRVGSSFRSSNGQIHDIKKVHRHHNYNPETYDYDISILELKTPLNFTNSIRAVSLASSGTIISDGLVGTATGYGRLSQNSKASERLKAVQLPIISTNTCKQYYDVTERMFCAGYDEGGKDTCEGDSGGPLVVSGILIGITSWGYECAKAKSPGVYSSIPVLRGYINSIIN